MTVYDILKNYGIEGYRLLYEENTPFLMRLDGLEFNGELYFQLYDPAGVRDVCMVRIRGTEIVEFYEFHTGGRFNRSDFEEFGLDIDSYDLLQYIIQRDSPGGSAGEIYIEEKGSLWLMRIRKDGGRQFYREIRRSDDEPEFADYFRKYAVNGLIAYYDGGKRFTGASTITVSADLACYQDYKDSLDIEYTF